ncbi:pimeloyl-CoA dehydrogenase small subunit [Chromatiales bacterium (ex Bugula neritina AB1)]|nr:pimeloyl-CoA dehydrogenase small subunit [Chromatiales bacterium (ex Bugula neritina AB1)]
MNFELTDDRRMLADTLSRYLREKYPIEHRMAHTDSSPGYSTASYLDLCELGIGGALMPESCGGFGGSGFDIAVVFEELGRGLCLEPFLSSTVLSANLLHDCAPGDQQHLISALMDGTKTASLGCYEPASRYTLNHIECSASANDRGWVLNGRKSQVINGDSADYLIISARTSETVDSETGISLFLLPATNSPGLELQHYQTVDGYRGCNAMLSDVVVPSNALLGNTDEGFAVLEKSIARGVVALCAEALGAMQVCKEMTVDYLQTRKQFGVPIGKFQVLQHRTVDLLIEIEQSRSAVINAAGHLDADRATRERYVAAAKNLIGRAARLISEEAIQIHGGIAMTWEYALSHYAKRLVMIDHLLGDTDHHLQRFSRFSADALNQQAV